MTTREFSELAISPNLQASIDFLKIVHPKGPWNLVSIEPDDKGIDGITFHPGQESEALAWLEQQGKNRNIYYTLNEVSSKISKKPSRADIKSMRFLHVDLDPRAGEDVSEEQDRILKQCEAMDPKPTFVVFSGGGYQCIWSLKDPFPINGQEEAYDEAKLWNLQLELQYDADHCHNVDRILRLPGTVNWPGAKKAAKGRTPQVAKVEIHNEVAYDLSQFVKAALAQTTDTGKSTGTVKVSGNVQRLDSLDGLPVGPLCRTVIAKGCDPDEPNKWSSRSEPLWWVICEMVRADVEVDTIYSIITDPDWSISGHVLDQSRPHDYAIRQIERAKDNAIDPLLCKLNDKYAVVQLGGQVKVLKEDIVPFNQNENRPVVNYMSFGDFQNFYSNQFITVSNPGSSTTAQIPVGRWWLAHQQRRSYEGVCFVPGKTMADRYNLWKGFNYEAKPGNCESFLTHIKDNLCRREKDLSDYLIGWMARLVQHPDKPGEVAVVFRGKQGTGKGFFANQFGKLLGRHYLPVNNSEHIFGKFNAHLQECVLLFADEAFWAGNKKQEGMLKALITESTIMSESKGVDAQARPNCMHLVMASNEMWVVPVGDFDRRFFVLDVGDDRRRDRDYFGGIVQDLENGGYEALLHYLMSYDLSDFDVTDAPETAAHKEQKEFSLSPTKQWRLGLLEDGFLPNNVKGEANKAFTCGQDGLYARAREAVPKLQHVTDSMLGRSLKPFRKGQATGSPRWYEFKPLAELRQAWDEKYGQRDWDGPDEWQAIVVEKRKGAAPVDPPIDEGRTF